MIYLQHERRKREAFLVLGSLLLFLLVPVTVVRVAAAAVLLIRALSFAYSASIGRFIRISRDTSIVYANCHQHFEITVIVENRSLLPIYFMSVQDSVSTGLFAANEASFVVSLRPMEKRFLSYTAVARSRGVYAAGPVRLSGHDPFRIYGFWDAWQAPVPVVVYPTVYPVEPLQRSGLPAGNIQVVNRVFEDMTRYSAIREYQPGDEMKRINWKASARMGKLFSMDYQPSIYYPILIALNLSEQDYPVRGRQSMVDRATEVAASLVFHAVRIKQEVGLVTTGSIPDGKRRPSVPIKAGYGNAVGILDVLARVQLEPEHVSIGEQLVKGGIGVPNGTVVFVVSPPLREDAAVMLMAERRKARRVELFVVRSRHMNRADEFVHDLPVHDVVEQGETLVHG